jgi:uncharacterized membrane protein
MSPLAYICGIFIISFTIISIISIILDIFIIVTKNSLFSSIACYLILLGIKFIGSSFALCLLLLTN